MKKTYKLFFAGASLKLDSRAQNLSRTQEWYSEASNFPYFKIPGIGSGLKRPKNKAKISCYIFYFRYYKPVLSCLSSYHDFSYTVSINHNF